MKRTERMNMVAEFADARADKARLQFAEQQQRVVQEELRLTELCRFRDEYANLLTEGKEVDVLQLLNHRQFLQRLNEAIAFQTHQVESYRTHLVQKNLHLREAHGRAKALENVAKRMSTQDQHAKDRHEQAQTEDFIQGKNSELWSKE